MSVSENKALVRRFLSEVVEAQDLKSAGKVLSPSYTLHMPGLPGPVRGLETWKGVIAGYFAAFPDLRVVLDDEIGEDDRVAIRYRWTGTHRGPFMNLAATGKQVNVPGTVVFRISDGLIAEEFHLDDMLGLLQQLGAVPEPEAAGARAG